jgi:hypothetical protein
MFDPWSLLGLDPHTATERDVRGAYARLLKKYRPDQDPEGFQRLRQAYEAALEWARNREAEEEEEEPVEATGRTPWEGGRGLNFSRDEDANAPEAEPAKRRSAEDESPAQTRVAQPQGEWPEAVRQAIAMLAQAFDKGSEKRAREAFHESWRVFRAERLSPQARVQAWREASQFNASRLTPVVSTYALVEQWMGGEWEFTQWLIGDGSCQARMPICGALAQCLLSHRTAVRDCESAMVALSMAELVALNWPFVARALINVAYVHLSPALRNGPLLETESRVWLGLCFSVIAWWRRPFWISVLRANGKTTDWTRWRNRRRLKKLAQSMPEAWEGWFALSELLPRPLWTQTEKRLKREEWWRRRTLGIRILRPRNFGRLLLVFMGVNLVGLGLLLLSIAADPIRPVVIHPHRVYPPLPPAGPPKPQAGHEAPPTGPKP